MEKNIDVAAALKYGFNSVFEHPGLFLLAGLVFVGLSCLSLVTLIFAPFIMAGLYAGFVKMVLEFEATGSSKVDVLFSSFRLMGRMLGASILYFSMVIVGYLCFIVPGVIWGIKFAFYPFFIVEKDCGVIEALRRSSRLMYGAKWSYFPLFIISGILHYVLNLTVIGVVFITPVLLLVDVFVYRQLLAQK